MQISLYHFKNHSEKNFTVGDGIQMLVGENGAGKSTFCEAFMIALNAENPHHTNWSEKTTFGMTDWSIRLQGEESHSVVYDGIAKSPKWYYREQSTTRQKYNTSLPSCALWIQSDHLRVISGEPGERRGFLDDMLASADMGYGHILKNYRTAISQRNKVIQDIQEGILHRRDLASWNTLLAQSAVPLILHRRKMFDWISHLPDESLHLPGPTRVLLLERHPLEEVTVESFLKLLREYEDRDIVVGKTTVGPQLDDIEFSVCIKTGEICKNKQDEEQDKQTKEFTNVNDGGGESQGRSDAKFFHVSQDEWKPARYTLSRGENKTLLLSFIKKIGAYIQHTSGKVPFFLLDDVLSELDEAHIRALLEIFGNTNTIITTQPNHTGTSTQGLPRIAW